MSTHDSKTRSTPVAMVAPELKHSTDSDSKITVACAVLGCENSKNLDEKSFFRFPEDQNLRQIWTDLTGRNNWTPTDYSYVCIQHFSVDCFECDAGNNMMLSESAVPSLKLPKHVLEVEYIDEESFDNEDNNEEYYEEEYMETDDFEDAEVAGAAVNKATSSNIQSDSITKSEETNGNIETNNEECNDKSKSSEINVEVLKLFTEVQKMQRQAVSLRDKLKTTLRIHNRQNRHLKRIEELIQRKRNILDQKRKKKAKILLSLQDKISEDKNGLLLAMPVRQTDDLKNFALGIYNYSPQAYIYIRNTLRTMLPSTDILESWLSSGYQPKSIISNPAMVKVTAEQTERELSCKVTLG